MRTGKIGYKLSLAFPIIGMLILLSVCTTLTHLYVFMNTMQDILWEKENSKSEDINFIVESLIEQETRRLKSIAKALKNRLDLIQGITFYSLSDKDSGPLGETMARIYPDLEVDVFEAIDLKKDIIFKAHNPEMHGDNDILEILDRVFAGKNALIAARIDQKWAVCAVVPASREKEVYGAIVVGTYINDKFAKNIAFATDVHISFGSMQGIFATSQAKSKIDIYSLDAIQKCIAEVFQIRIENPDEFKVIHYVPFNIADKLLCLIVDINTQPSITLLEQNRKHIIKIAVIILLVSLCFGIIFTMYLVRPLKALKIKAKDTVKNIAGVDLKDYRGNEIQSLVKSFDLMVATVLDHIKVREKAEQELKTHQEQLEDAINERTTALWQSNEKLTNMLYELELRNSQIRLLSQMGDMLQACGNENETYDVLISTCKQIFKGDAGFLGIMDDTHKIMKTVAKWGDLPEVEEEFEQHDCWGIRRGKEHIISDPQKDTLCPHMHKTPKFGSICTPMSAQGEVLGMLHLYMGPPGAEDQNKERRIINAQKVMLIRSILERYAPGLTNLRLRERLRIQSIRDPLTGLYNRRHMEDALERETRRAKRKDLNLGIIMLDVDHFKEFNDANGHEAGDVALREMGAYLQKFVRKEDIACRYGGEEFTLIMADSSPEHTFARAQEIRKGIKNNLRIKHQDSMFKITVSLGVASFPEHGVTSQEILHAADLALYRAKKMGRDQVVMAKNETDDILVDDKQSQYS